MWMVHLLLLPETQRVIGIRWCTSEQTNLVFAGGYANDAIALPRNPSDRTPFVEARHLQFYGGSRPNTLLFLPGSKEQKRTKPRLFALNGKQKRSDRKMACLQLPRSGLLPTFRLPHRRRPTSFHVVSCRLGGDNNGEEPPESLFMKELKRRGMTPGSLLEKDMEETDIGEDDSDKAGPTSQELFKQRERSMALNSEGLEGLVPRAKLLLSIGSTFFLGFWPLITLTFGLFAILYFFLGPSFVHDASKISMSAPPYIDPYTLLEDERISQAAKM
ncbi:hypothetical protein LUZ60_004695 [Juncus effusus]|nr:hypothetical protein LUZ60_004695 [Juncus effusus]